MRPRQELPCYADGRPFRGLHGLDSGHPRRRTCATDQVISLSSTELGWSRFWEIINRSLTDHGYADTTCQVYRCVLRGFYKFFRRAPAATTASAIRSYIDQIVADGASCHWVMTNITVLRTVFDKLGGRSLTMGLVSPRRAHRLPVILSRSEVRQLLGAAETIRDQLLLGLMVGCGLKVSETCSLRWADIDVAQQVLTVAPGAGKKRRWLPLPEELIPVLRLGVARCPSSDYIFQGQQVGHHLGPRMVQLIVRGAARRTAIPKPVTCMVLRHTFAVHCLEAGESVRALQEALGHESIDTTLRYEGCILAPGIESPLDALRQSRRPASIQAPALFAEAPCIEGLELPFASPSTPSLAQRFYTLLRTHIVGRFLGVRRAAAPPG